MNQTLIPMTQPLLVKWIYNANESIDGEKELSPNANESPSDVGNPKYVPDPPFPPFFETLPLGSTFFFSEIPFWHCS